MPQRVWLTGLAMPARGDAPHDAVWPHEFREAVAGLELSVSRLGRSFTRHVGLGP